MSEAYTIRENKTAKIDRFGGQVAPEKEALRDLLTAQGPVPILMDELLEYVTKAAG